MVLEGVNNIHAGARHCQTERHQIHADGHRASPVRLLQTHFATLHDTLDNIRTLDLDRINTDGFSKECINSLLGLWSKIRHHTWSAETASYTEDLQRAGPSVK